MKIRYLAFLTLLFWLPSAYAIRLEPAAKVCNLYFKSDAVFIGKVIASIPYSDANDGPTYTLKVIKSFRGVSGQAVKVFSEASDWELELSKGSTYLLFAYRGSDGRLVIGDDGLSGRLRSGVLTKLKHVIAASHEKNGGEIYGRVGGGDVLAEGVHDVHVRIAGAKKTYQVVTNPKGWFHISVPAGKYSAVATDPADSKKTFPPGDLSRDDPDSFLVRNGECAELQFQ